MNEEKTRRKMKNDTKKTKNNEGKNETGENQLIGGGGGGVRLVSRGFSGDEGMGDRCTPSVNLITSCDFRSLSSDSLARSKP